MSDTALFPPPAPCCAACCLSAETEALRALLRHARRLPVGPVQGELRALLRAELAAALETVAIPGEVRGG